MSSQIASPQRYFAKFPGAPTLDPDGGGGGAQRPPPHTPSSTGFAPFMRCAHKGFSQVRLRRTQVTPFKKSWIRPC